MRKPRSLLIILGIVMALQFPLSGLSQQAKGSHWKWHSTRYQKTRSYRSLKVLVKRLKIGMRRSVVEGILGEAEYSPVEGQYYYSSDKRNAEGVTMGLVVEYRKTAYRSDGIHTTVTGKLESFTLMPIGE